MDDATRICSVPECGREMSYPGYGLCGRHYARFKRSGSTELRPYGPAPRSLEERFWAKVDKRGKEECWPWLGKPAANGYGVIADADKKQKKAHRVAYELLIGPIPDGMTLDHLCHTRDTTCVGVCAHRSCVNPNHLEVVDIAENVRRGRSFSSLNAAKETCVRGHDISDPSSFYRTRTGGRACWVCDKVRKQERRRAA